MKTYSILICFFLTLVGFTRAINYEKCGNGKGLVTIRKFSLDPDPIVFSRRSVTISASAEMHDDIDSDTIIETKIWKITWVLFGIKAYIRAPCILGDGYCYAEYCKLLNRFTPYCLRQKGIHSIEDTRIDLPDLGGAAGWFASGHFHIELRLFDKYTKAEKGCYIITGEAHQ